VVWSDGDKPDLDLQKAHLQMDVDWPKFQNLLMQWMCLLLLQMRKTRKCRIDPVAKSELVVSARAMR
jgi:hypothetical protein